MLYTEELCTGRAGSPSFDINLGQNTMVTQTPERQYPQRMINNCSSDASCQATSSQSTLRVSPLGPLLDSEAPSMPHTPHFQHLVYLPGWWYSAVRAGQDHPRAPWGDSAERGGVSPHCRRARVSGGVASLLFYGLVCWVWSSIVVRQPLSISLLTRFFPFPADIWQM